MRVNQNSISLSLYYSRDTSTGIFLLCIGGCAAFLALGQMRDVLPVRPALYLAVIAILLVWPHQLYTQNFE